MNALEDAQALDGLLEQAVLHHRGGAFDEAERFYALALAMRPSHSGAAHSLAVLDNQRGQFAPAVARLGRLLEAGESTSAVWNDYGIALAGLGRKEEAVAAYRQALTLSPGSLEAVNNLGEALRSLGRFSEALPLLERACATRPALWEVRANLAHVLAALERWAEALAHYLNVLAAAPDHAAAHRGAGLMLAALKRPEEAVGHLQAVSAASPHDPQAWIELARTLSTLRRHEEAQTASREAIALAPDRAEAHFGLGQALIQLSRVGDALASLDAALALDPGFADAHHARGNALQTLGRTDASREAYQTAVRLAPDRPAFHYSLAEAGRFSPGDPRLQAMEVLAAGMDGFDAAGRTALHYALAKAYDDLGRHGRAFRHLGQGAALKRAEVEYNEAATLAMFRRIAEVFTADLLRDRGGQGTPSPTPVFIVGMPRSGTTLIEQVLASHPQVFGAGELAHLRTLAGDLAWEDGRRAFPDIVPSLDAATLRRLGGEYLDKVLPLAPSAARITDKMPENFPYVGLIHLILPQARIIHAQRDPADVCLSCYFKLFGGHQPHTYDLAELGRYACAYDRLMAHWAQATPPGVMLQVRYEALVADFEPQARRILAHCGLEWDERCRDFHRTERPVRTASAVQVRRPLYGSSIGRWRPYRRLLQPLFQEIDPPQADRAEP